MQDADDGRPEPCLVAGGPTRRGTMGAMTLDPVARLLLDEAGTPPGRVLVVDDVGGALTRHLIGLGTDVRAWCDDLRDERAVPADVRTPPPTPADDWRPDLVLWRLPKGMGALEDIAERLSGVLPADGRVLAGGRTKHMTQGQNEVLARSFEDVSASLGRQKCRVLRATGPRRPVRSWPRRGLVGEAGLTVVAHGGVFSTHRLDDGTRLLLQSLGRTGAAGGGRRGRARGRGGGLLAGGGGARGGGGVAGAGAGRRALDLGSGSGIIAAWLAARGWVVDASDVSTDAVASTLLTAEANGLTVAARRSEGLEGSSGYDLIASNPPFHRGPEKDSTATLAMIREASVALAPGGEFWLVFNSHLPYLPELRRHVGPTEVVVQDRHYLVTRSRAR